MHPHVSQPRKGNALPSSLSGGPRGPQIIKTARRDVNLEKVLGGKTRIDSSIYYRSAGTDRRNSPFRARFVRERERESCSFSQKTRPVRIIGAGVRSRSTNSGGRGEGRKFMKVIRAGRRRSVIGVGAGRVSLLWAARNQTFRPINIYDV